MLTVRFDRLGLTPGSRVLDLGCGDGRHARETRRLPGVATIAADAAAEPTRSTAASLRNMDATDPAHGGTVPDAGPWLAMRASAYALPFRTGAFDCVILSEVLEHLDADRAALNEVARVLRPGATLAVSVPRTVPEAVCWALSREYRSTPGGHVRIYRRSVLRSRLAESGFRISAGHFAHALHAPFWWLKCIVGLDNERFFAVSAYRRLLVWDLMRKPRATRLLEALLNPFLGKSLVLYAVKIKGERAWVADGC